MTRLEKVSHAANVAIALVAIVGFFVSIRSSRDIARDLAKFHEATRRVVQPILYLSQAEWAHQTGLSCDNPPIGVVMSMKNGGLVPIEVVTKSADYFWGIDPISGVETKTGHEGPSILPPGEDIQFGVVQADWFQSRMLHAHNNALGPYLEIKVEYAFRTIGTNEWFGLVGHYQLSWDCHAPYTVVRYTVKEEIAPKANGA